ncbi:cell morphogenesis protein-like protein, partial [Aureobasidium melanogenum]
MNTSQNASPSLHDPGESLDANNTPASSSAPASVSVPPSTTRGRAPSAASRAPSSRAHTPAAQSESVERKSSVSYGHHRQTSIVHGYQHSRNPSHVSSTGASPISPGIILAQAPKDGPTLRQSPSSSTLNAPADQVPLRRLERMHSGRIKREHEPHLHHHHHHNHRHHRSRSRQHHQQEPTTVGEYALHHLLNEFISEANDKINRCVSERDDALIRVEAICGPGADHAFDQLIKALGHIVRPRPKPLIDALMIWRKSKSDELTPIHTQLQAARAQVTNGSATARRADLSQVSTNSSSASLPSHTDPATIITLEQNLRQGERRSAISVYILCRVLMQVISQCTLAALTNDIAERLEDVIYGQLRNFDSEALAYSALKQSQWNMFGQLLGVMGNLRFDKVADRYVSDLEAAQRRLSVKGNADKDLENHTALLVHSMRWLKIQTQPEAAWDKSCDLLHLLAGFFAGVHGKPVKYAYCQLFEDLLLPVASKATTELNSPKWRQVLDVLKVRLNQLLAKPKHWAQAFPIFAVTICVSPNDVFQQQWLSTALHQLQPKLKERTTRGHALKALCRLVWVYLYRASETQLTTFKKLDDIIRMVFMTGKKSLLSTEPSIADPLIQLIRIIGFKHQDLCFRSIIFPLMNADVIITGRDRRIENLDPEKMVIAIRAFLAIMSDLEKGDQPPFPVSFECDALTDPFSRSPNSHRRSLSQTHAPVNGAKVERLSKPVMTAGFGDVAKESYVKFCKILGEITIICDETFGGQKVLDEKFSAQTIPKTPMADAFSFSRRDELFNSPEVRQNFYDLLHVAVQALPRCLSPQIPLKNLINLLCTGTAHVQNHIASSSAQSLKSIARQSHAQLVTIGFARFIFNFDDRYATVSAGSLLGHGHIESTLRLYVELLEIWIEELKSQPQMATPDLHDDEYARGMPSDLNRSRVFAHVDEIESHGLFFLCSPSRHVRAYAVRVLSLITKFDTALGQPSTRIISVLEGSSQQVIDVNDEKLSLAERSRLQKGLRKSNMNNTLVELCSSETVHDLALWSKAFPNLIRLSSQICPQAVLLTRDIVCARLSHAHRIISTLAEGPRANTYAALETAFSQRMVGRTAFSPPEVTIEQWKLHLIFACTTLTNTGGSQQPPVPRESFQHSRKGSKASSINQEKIGSACELFVKVVPFLSAIHPGVREAAVHGLGAINTNLFRPLLEALQPSVSICSEDARQWLMIHQRSLNSPRRSRRSDSLRTELTHLYQLTSHCLFETEVYNDEWILQNLVSFTKDLRIFLNDEDVQNQWDFQKLRTYYCGLVEVLYEGIHKTKDPIRWMPFHARKAAFSMMEDWCGFSPNQTQIRQKENHMRKSILDQEQDSRTRGNVTAKLEIEKKDLRTAALSAMASLCAGPVMVSTDGQITMQFDVRRMLKWIDAIFDSASDRTHATGRRALKNLLVHNSEHSFLLSHSIEECYHAKNPKALFSYFTVATQVLTDAVEDRIPFWKILSAALYTLGNENSEIRMKSARLLRTLEERLGKSSKLQDLDISISDKTTAVYKLAQFEISRRLAKQHADMAFHVFSEFTRYFGGLVPDHQRNMVAAMLPWIQTVELQLLPSGGPTASSYMLMVNLFEITARSSSVLHNEIQALWQALATGPYGGNVQVVLDFIIAICLDRREQNFVDYAKQIVVFLSTTAAGLKVIEFLLLQITPKAMIAEKRPPPSIPQDPTNLPYIADLAQVLPIGNRQSGLSLGQLALMLLVDLVVSPVQLPKNKIPLLLQVVVVQWDHYTPLVQDQAREMLVHMIHELVISQIGPEHTGPSKQGIEDLIESIRQHDPKVVWSYEETDNKGLNSNSNGVPEPMVFVIEEVVRVLSFSYDDIRTGDNIRRDWARMSLVWATTCAVRHVACRSFQIFRCIIDSLDRQMMADMLARLTNTIADDENDCLTFSQEILITLRTIISALEPEDLIQYPQLFWTTSACLDTIFEQEFQASLSMLDRLLDKLDLSDPAVIKLFNENKPAKWDGDFEGLQPLVYKGLRSNACLDRSLEMLERMIKLPSSSLIGGDNRLLFTLLANLPRYLHCFEDDSNEQICFESADSLAGVAEAQQLHDLAHALNGFANQRYRNANDFLTQVVAAARAAWFPAMEYQSLIFLIGLLNNHTPWFRVTVMQLLCVLIPQIDMRRPEIVSQGPDLISPLLRLLQTSYCQQALDVLDNIMSVTGTPLDNKHLRMSMAGSHSTRATRKEYDSTKSLYGIPEESGWSIPMPAIQAERARKNVMAVYYTCLDTAPADGAEISSTPDVAFTTEDQYGSYFDQRSATAMSDSIRADGSMSELVLKLDSLDDFFDDRKPITTREASRGSIENRENVYEQQTLPILHKSLKRNASVTSFQNGFSDTRFALAREPVVMNPGAFASSPATVVTRPALHASEGNVMMAAEVDEELQLMRASAELLSDLQAALSKLLWKRGDKGRVHHLVRSRDLDHVIQLIEPFQGEPQLLDAHLKTLLPPIVEAYLAFLQVQQAKSPSSLTVSLDVAASKLLYTFCKVRGEKIIIGFLNNEPRYLELVLANLEDFRTLSAESDTAWEKSYVLLLWLTHLMLVPFDLSSISAVARPPEVHEHMSLQPQVPSIARRVIALGIHYLASPTREQDAAARMLVRLVTRPDMQRLELPAALVSWALTKLLNPSASPNSNLHTFLGPLRFLVGMTVSVDTPEVASLMPSIYSVGQRLMDDAMLAFLSSSAVTKKLVVKLLRNVALLSLQCSFDGLIGFFEASNVLEETIEYCLQSLEDRDTPVRFAASKALSMIILRLDPEMGHEVIQAVLESFKEDMPKSSSKPDFGAANALRWHGLTLTLAHALFRRSASPQQLPEILNALLLALSFEQRSAVGTPKLRPIVSALISSSDTSVSQVLPRLVMALSRLSQSGFLTTPILNLSDCLPRIAHDASAPLTEWRIVGLQAVDLMIQADTIDADILPGVLSALDAGLNDYTITERGDVGSLVRTQAIQCVQRMWKSTQTQIDAGSRRLLEGNIIRLSLEKMDRVRLQAARCLEQDLNAISVSDVDVTSYRYFLSLFAPLNDGPPSWKRDAILKGSISCAGVGAEGLLRASRMALVDTLSRGCDSMRSDCLSALTNCLRELIAKEAETQPLLELIAYLLDALPSIVPLDGSFNWRVLLSLVQKAHFKSNNIPRILAAIEVYQALAEKPTARADTLKKLVSMLRTNPYPTTQADEHPIRFILIISLLLPLSYFVTNEFIRKNARIPGFNGPPGKLVFGNIPDIKYNAAEKYREWSKTYGDVYQIQLGNIPIIVCNSAEACRVLFGHFSQALSSRPVFYTFHKVLSNTAGTTIGTSPFSDSLKRRRKGAASALNKPSVASYVGHLDVETLAFVKEGLEYGAAGTQSVDPMPMIQRLSLSLALTLNWGTRLGSRNDPLFHEITEVEEEISKFRSTSGNMQDYVPFLRLNPFNAGSTRAREMRQRRDVYLTKLNKDLDDRMAKGTHKPCIQANVIQDKEAKLNKEELTSISLTMLSGGLDTVTTLVAWSIALLGQRPDIQEKAIREIRKMFSEDEILCAPEDEMKCEYVMALVKECLRYYTVLRLALPRATVKDITYEGKLIPAGTTIYLNAWACNMDPAVWKDPEVFRPERWLEQPDAPLFTYGVGYRMCAGSLLANRELYLVFMRMLSCFEIEKGTEVETHPVKGSSDPTSLVSLPHRYEVKFRPRNEVKLREQITAKEKVLGEC